MQLSVEWGSLYREQTHCNLLQFNSPLTPALSPPGRGSMTPLSLKGRGAGGEGETNQGNLDVKKEIHRC